MVKNLSAFILIALLAGCGGKKKPELIHVADPKKVKLYLKVLVALPATQFQEKKNMARHLIPYLTRRWW